MNNAFLREPCIKVTMMGCCNVGKTAIINRLVNKCFTFNYEPTTDIVTYSLRINLNEEEVVQKTYINLIIQDTFGLNNPILDKPPELLTSKILKDKREQMTKQFRDLMFTSNEMRNKISNNEKKTKFSQKKGVNIKEEIFMETMAYESEDIQRGGFVFVCDSENDKSLEQVIKIIEKLQEIEKSNNLIYPKMLLFNKSDKVNEKTFKESIKKYQNALESFKGKFKIESLRVSALTGQGIIESFKMFLSKIHQEQKNQKQNDGIQEPDEEDDMKVFKPGCVDNLNSCSKSIFCGKTMFSCGNQDDNDED